MKKEYTFILSLFSFISLLALVLGFIVVNVYLSSFGFYDFSIFQTRYIVSGFLPAVCIALFCFGAIGIEGDVLKNRGLFSVIFLIGIICTLTITILYGKLLYPHIPFEFGGGQPVYAGLLFKDESKDIVPSFKPLGTSEYLLVDVLYQTSDFLVIRTDRGVFLVYRDQIQSIYYLADNLVDFKQIGKGLIFASDK